MKELSEKLYARIQESCRIGDEFAEKGGLARALKEYGKAYDLIPEPKTNWEATTRVLTAIGDVNFLRGDYKAAKANLSDAMHCPNAIGNPFIHMRLGQSCFELNELDRAADEMTRAYAVEGEEIFSEDDPKYFEFLKTRIVIEKSKKKPWWKF